MWQPEQVTDTVTLLILGLIMGSAAAYGRAWDKYEDAFYDAAVKRGWKWCMATTPDMQEHYGTVWR